MKTSASQTRHPQSSIFHPRIVCVLLCAFCAFSWPALLFAKDTPPRPPIKVVDVTGKARYTTNITAKTWAPVQCGTLLPAGSVIQTAGNRSTATLILEQKQHHGFDPQRRPPFYTWTENASILTVYENSVIAIDRFDFEKAKHGTISHTHIDLRAGGITIDTRKLPTQSDFQVTSDKLTAKITPGEYLITAAGRVQTGSGSALLEIKHPDGTVTTTQVNANLLYDPATDRIMPIPTDSKFPGILDDTDLFAPRAKAPTTPNLRPGI